jgi:NAD(P)-dependent dehydrogenase (short-subunit alcohol dehydrogenase family)
MRLKDKSALITGAASGIGKATALLFGREGAKVMCADIDGEGAERVARQIADSGGQAAAVRADVSVPADAERMVRETVELWGRIDILFNNAGIEFGLPVTQVPEEEWDRLIDVNLKGVFLGCKYAIPEMLKQGGGSIVNTASAAGLRGVAWLSTYSASKGGVVLLTKSLAQEWGTQNVRVNAVCPGVIRTPMADQAIEQGGLVTGNDPEETWRRIGQAHALGRVGEADEVARAVLFLASEEASFITGAALPVDGGFLQGGVPQRPGE